MHTAAPLPSIKGIETQIQDEIDYDQQRAGRRVVIRVTADPRHNLCGAYEGDMAISASLDGGRLVFRELPLHDAYFELLKGFFSAANEALNHADAGESARRISTVRLRFAYLGHELHQVAARTVCSDPSRLTTAFTLANTYSYTLLQVSRHLLGDAEGLESVIVIDRYLGGIQCWDGAGIDWGYVPAPAISRVHRTDLSRGMQYLSAQPDEAREDARLNDLMALLAGADSSIHRGVPNSIHTPIADAYRGTVASITREVASAAAQWRELVRSAARERSDFNCE